MNDAEFLFKQTEKDRKRIGYGAKNKKRGGGRYVRTPSDNLTKKERNAMNSEVTTYNITKPMSWDEFKQMPKDLQQQHIDFIQSNFECGPCSIANNVFNLSCNIVKKHCDKNGIKIITYGRGSRPLIKKLNAWLGNEQEPVLLDKEDVKDQVTKFGSTWEDVEKMIDDIPAVPNAKQEVTKDTNNIAQILAMLVGTGAKVSIELTL